MTEAIIKCGNLEIRPDTELARHYCQYITRVDEMPGGRWFIHSGEDFTIELSIITHDLTDKNDLMNLWKKHGYIKETSPTHIGISTYHTEQDGSCYGRYNITHTANLTLTGFFPIRPATPRSSSRNASGCGKWISGTAMTDKQEGRVNREYL